MTSICSDYYCATNKGSYCYFYYYYYYYIQQLNSVIIDCEMSLDTNRMATLYEFIWHLLIQLIVTILISLLYRFFRDI